MKPRQRLRWKLTASYVLVTISALLVVEIACLVVLFVFINPLRETRIPKPELHLISLAIASTLRIMPSGAIDNAESLNWLVGDSSGLALFVIDPAGQQRLALPPDAVLPDQPDMLNAALAGQADSPRMYATLPDNRLLHSVPILGEDGHVLAALVVVATPTTFAPRLLLITVVIVGLSLLLFTGIAALIGAIFGSLTASGFSRRFETLAAAAAAWGNGDFTVHADDPTPDEIGQLSERFNAMARQLHGFMQTNQELATLAERNRLARDLHDSVKQQIFAISMQIAAASAKLKIDTDAAQQHLCEAASLVQGAQQELSGIIHELRPPLLLGNGLTAALREYVENWSRQQGIRADLELSETNFTHATEQVLLRIAQEALSNVARHSGATQVTVTLSRQGTVSIQDNGSGFDRAAIRAGIGFQSMHERLSAIQGTLTISSKPGDGTLVVASISKDGQITISASGQGKSSP